MDTINVQALWRIMEALRGADYLEEALSAALDILRGARGAVLDHYQHSGVQEVRNLNLRDIG